MTLPPVVSDAEVCPKNRRSVFTHFEPHDWEGVIRRRITGPDDGAEYRLCRYCGGRKPTDAAPTSEGRGVEG